MGFIPTVAILVAAMGLAAFGRYKANQTYVPGAPRYINWNIVMIFAVAVAILMLVHLFSLSGMDVGGGRRMP